jgi:hypothetical protein
VAGREDAQVFACIEDCRITKSANKPLQRSGTDKVLGRGRRDVVLGQVLRARVLERTRPAAERGC